ncbi:MAG: ROK family protein [Gammaproteobacteria bacterium]
MGGTHVRVGVVDVDGHLLTHTQESTDARRGPEAVLATLQQTIRTLSSSTGSPLAIGVACAGQIDPVTGAVVYAPNLGWRDVPLGALLARGLNIPVVVENDVRAAAWGEFVAGAARREGSLVAVFVGTGIGSGAVLDGRLWRGAGNAAGEVGHTQVVPDGLPCRCGRDGCLEQYVSGSGLQRRLAAAMADGRATTMIDVCAGDASRVDARDIYEAAMVGDALARELWSDATRFLTMAVANYVTMLNPSVLVMGGGVIATVPALFDAVAERVPKLTTLLAARSLRIERAALGDLSGLLGAAALAKPA